ncbi:MAG: SDR family NAD(P)-dependent oxidoreductase [Deferribacterales bacterium]|uniref:SDR family NAD(P)-dependent oxidoreductase n=1 Tax=Deferrivibrio essentukiensis TaxID=2880922 RepID=UPI00198608BB|nr:SDR family NAD(P)-dependent oxidoreductase [Deferrivibrio essentukiensis]MBC7196290.1 SDR family NAD(P)-dependent oxidoreductase [Deferribacterales bacterium]MCB4203569.1 SDR family NAD(P)-dependent oxidoreductase [Deferrivibrio essentukiensis]
MKVFVTGSTSGFGEAIAYKFINNGHDVVISGRRKERLSEISKKSGCLFELLDVTKKEDVFKVFEKHNDIDILVNNAGLALGLEPAHETNIEDWERMIDTNIKGVVYCTRAILPFMVKRNKGHIINIGSVAGSWPYPGGNVYGSTKAFVAQFSRNLRNDLFGTKVRCTNIEPGMANTEFSTVRFKGDKNRADKVYENTKPLTSEDIAEAVYWCATLPEHVNINSIELMSVYQTWNAFRIYRDENID